MTDIKLKKAPNETETQYVYRLASAREDGLLDMTWEDLAKVFNDELGKHQCSSAYRKPYQNAQRYRDEVFNAADRPGELLEIQEARQELYKERVKLRDERNALNKQLREEARKEVFVEQLASALVDVPPIRVSECTVDGTQNTEIVACLSDLHVGLTASNSANYYDEEVLHSRLEEYASELCQIQKRHKASKLILALLGDQISGSIHAAITATNSMNTVTQVKRACTEIAGFIQALCACFPRIEVYSVSGNHSRVNAKKEDNLPGDNLDSLIPFYLKAIFGKTDRVSITDDTGYGEYFNEFRSCGWSFVMMHGDLDTTDKAVYNATQIRQFVPDVVLVGHRHNSGLLTEGQTRVVQTGCLCGTDAYAYNKRLFAPPEQAVIIVTDRRPIECLYNVQF